jgi:hypothetical protein
MPTISISSVKDKGEEYESLMALVSSKTHVSDLPLGCVINIPANAQFSRVGCREFFSDKDEAMCLCDIDMISSPSFIYLSVLPVVVAKHLLLPLTLIEQEQKGEGEAVFVRCRYRWQMPRHNARHVQMLAPSLSEYLGEPCPFGIEEVEAHAA